MKTAVLSFGRFNPITVGHLKLATKIKAIAKTQKATPLLFLSHSHDNSKNPLSYKDKVRYARLAFGSMVQKSKARTIIEVFKELDSSYDKIIVVVGSDRISEFKRLLEKYNGKDYTYESIQIVSAGERDPDSEDVRGMSASKMRAAAADNDLDLFTKGLPPKLRSKAKEIFDKVRKGINIQEALTLAQRRKRKRIMRKNKAKIARGQKLARRRKATPEKIQKRAEKKARDIMKKKMSGGKTDLTPAQKEKIEKRLEKRKNKIKALARKLKPAVRKKEKERFAKKKESFDLEQLSHIVSKVHREQIAEKVRDNLQKKAEKHNIPFEKIQEQYLAYKKFLRDDREIFLRLNCNIAHGKIKDE